MAPCILLMWKERRDKRPWLDSGDDFHLPDCQRTSMIYIFLLLRCSTAAPSLPLLWTTLGSCLCLSLVPSFVALFRHLVRSNPSSTGKNHYRKWSLGQTNSEKHVCHSVKSCQHCGEYRKRHTFPGPLMGPESLGTLAQAKLGFVALIQKKISGLAITKQSPGLVKTLLWTQG